MLKVKKSEGLCHAVVEGEMTIYTAAELKQVMSELVDEALEVEIDLSRVSEIDTSGVQLLMMIKKYRKKSEKELRITGQSLQVKEALSILGLDVYFNDSELIPVGTGDNHGV